MCSDLKSWSHHCEIAITSHISLLGWHEPKLAMQLKPVLARELQTQTQTLVVVVVVVIVVDAVAVGVDSVAPDVVRTVFINYVSFLEDEKRKIFSEQDIRTREREIAL